MNYIDLLQAQQAFFKAGNTLSYAFRLAQLKKLQSTLINYEKEIYDALKKDLGKGELESFASEYGMVLSEINLHINKLKCWMKPQRVRTSRINFPSSTKIYRDPRGVVLIIAPWNYPFLLLMIPLVGAISGGNCVVIKPSEYALATEAIVEKIIHEAFPSNYVLLCKGDGAVVVPALMEVFRFDHVFFTGSIPVGRKIYQMAAAQLTPVTLELGGKSPVVVHADADLKVASQRIALGKWLNAGQTCIAPDYVLVEETIKKAFVKQLKSTIESFYKDASTSKDYGKIINTQRFEKLLGYLSNGTIVTGGSHKQESLFIAPTLLENVLPDAPVMQEEIFGPILPVFSFSTKEEALQIIERNSHPLAFYLFTNDTAVQSWWMQRLSFGGGCINNTVFHFAGKDVPFGGVGNSGIGSYHGKYSYDTFTHAKPVLKTPNWFEFRLKYPPFGKWHLKLFKWLMK